MVSKPCFDLMVEYACHHLLWTYLGDHGYDLATWMPVNCMKDCVPWARLKCAMFYPPSVIQKSNGVKGTLDNRTFGLVMKFLKPIAKCISDSLAFSGEDVFIEDFIPLSPSHNPSISQTPNVNSLLHQQVYLFNFQRRIEILLAISEGCKRSTMGDVLILTGPVPQRAMQNVLKVITPLLSSFSVMEFKGIPTVSTMHLSAPLYSSARIPNFM